MRLSSIALAQALLMLSLLSACGSMVPPSEANPQPDHPVAGRWSLEYTGSCTGREAESILITRLDQEEIVFDEFRLLPDEQGHYSGGANFIAPMPVDGREIGYSVAYQLSRTEDGGFIGSETVVEGGGHGIDCPVELRYIGEN